MIEDSVRRRLDALTKPPGSLGRLEEIVIRYAEISGKEPPRQLRAAAFVFCADHGVTEEGVSAWPREVTRQMVRNFVAGGAAINVLCRHASIASHIIDVGVCGDPVEGVENRRIACGTKNFAREPAMSLDQARQAMQVGAQCVEQSAGRYDLLLCGEMGIGNTTAATALLCAYAGCDPEAVTGPGAGLDAAGVSRKAAVIRRALALHPSRHPLEIAANLGGFEILAIAGLIRQAAAARLPVMLDGFISCAGALVAGALEPGSLNAVLYSHCSAERGHRAMLEFLKARPLLDLDMRLGEGTGAVLATMLMQAAIRIYHEMATFGEAGVSSRN